MASYLIKTKSDIEMNITHNFKTVIKSYKSSSIMYGVRGGLILFAFLLFSCTDKEILPNNGGDNKYGTEEEIELTFSMFLNQLPSTRADESIDNYIDHDHLQVLFFDAEGNFMFKDSNAKVDDTPDKNGQYYITTSLTNSIVDDSGNSILSLIRGKMEADDGFKIAVLANWYEGANKPYTLTWGWDQSVFNDEDNCKTINDLHHLKNNSHYFDNTTRKSVYGPYMDGEGNLGFNSNWVQWRNVEGKEFTNPKDNAWNTGLTLNNNSKIQSGDDKAFQWIRNNWDPEIDKKRIDGDNNAKIYRDYAKLWQLWNLGGSFDNSLISYSDMKVNNEFTPKWKSRNGDVFKNDWFGYGKDVLSQMATPVSGTKQSALLNDGLSIVTKSSYISGTDKVEDYARSYSKNNLYGIILPSLSEYRDNNKVLEDYTPSVPKTNKPWIKTSSDYANEYFEFEVPGTGTLRVLFSSFDTNKTKIVVQRGSNWEMTFETMGTEVVEITNEKASEANTNKVINYSSIKTTPEKSGYQVKITEDPEPLRIFCLEGTAVIYAIEYVADVYLRGTDREGMEPSEKYPIPMYGVEDFPKINGWGSTKTMNISQNGKIIYLIRALAKVEVYLPAGDNTLTHIYMRSMNQYGFNEPMDVEAPTGNLWKIHESGENNCEWFRIQSHGSGFNGSFEDWFGWFYGSWESWWPNLKDKSFTNPPHLFNPDNQRADFCHFLRDWNYEDSSLHRYYLYLPDKNISDPNTDGDLTSTPKVPHIEYRYANNSDYLDDNDCYRVYFTDYSTNNKIKTVKVNGFNDYEKGMGDDGKYNIDQHWPIMRNHIYRFYIGTSNTPQEVRVKVLPWGDDDVKKIEW